jgi:hypothetical protein
MQNNKKKEEVLRISRSESNDFLKQYHYLSAVSSGKSYGYFIDGELSGLAVFSEKKIDKFSIGELLRFMVIDNYPNNSSKVLAAILRNMTFDAVISYTDEEHGHKGTIYSAIGAIDLGTSGDTVGFRLEDGRVISGRNASYALLGKEDKVTPVRIKGKRKFLIILNKRCCEELGNLFR